MIALIAYYWYGLLIAFGIGLVTAWWVWTQLPVAMPIEVDPDDELLDWESEQPMPSPAAPSGFARIETVEDQLLIGGAEPAPEEVAPPVSDQEETAHIDEGEAEPAPASLIEHGVDELTSALSDELAPAITASSEAAMDAVEPVQDEAEALAEPDAAAIEDHVEPLEPRVEEPEPVVPAGKAPDDLMVIKGIGPQIDALLRSLGVQRFEDIAGWMPEDIERIDGQLGIFKGHIIRDEWIGQARLLAKGDMETFNQRYGHLS
ncbi:hypothetical protein [Sphingobium nicotianae]|uniref:Uncharacterized protein n=1 Tax=Sphingobium nicotianae TaxID=2782607 RepID=A0A9X1DA64_9SPHN|nr:hypothetical protein [Sphingobium nicotianae]MBT2186220.1 hypothetical protein [Sphingobium nicotianae]